MLLFRYKMAILQKDMTDWEMHNIIFLIVAFGLVSEEDLTGKRSKNKARLDTCLTCADHT